MTKYRIKEFDPVNDIWFLQKHVFWFIWVSMSVGSKKELETFISDNQEKGE